jgi:uncharacterized membrane protein (DUF4010 family)
MEPGTTELWQAVGIALAIGLLVGAERERSTATAAGVRTYALVALVGNLATLLPTALGALVLAGIALLVVVGYALSRGTDPGMTSEVALLATATLGALTGSSPALAVGVAVALVVLLASKESLHHFLRESVSERERTDALKFFVAAFVVLPLLPEEGMGPYGVLSPRRIWMLVVLITGIGWIGYAATRALGARRGLLLAGLAGGFVSGTATIGAMAGRARRAEVPRRAALAGAGLASVATLVQIAALTSVVDRSVAVRLYPAMAAGIVVLLAEAWWLGRNVSAATGKEQPVGRPFALLPALVLAAVISLVVVLATWMQDRYGAAGATAVAATGSLADVHATAVALAGLAHDRQLSVTAAVLAIALGLATNTGSKVVAAATVGGAGFAARVLLMHVPVALVIGVLVLVFG